MRIKLDTPNDVKEFVNRAMMCKFDIDLVSNNHTVDAKSIMGIFSLDLSKPINLDVDDVHAKERELFMFEEWKVEN